MTHSKYRWVSGAAATLGLVLGLGCANTRGAKQIVLDDGMLARQIERDLMVDGQASALEADVKVYDGRVVLVGEVDDEQAKMATERIAKSVSGVRSVENALEVPTEERLIDPYPDAWVTMRVNTDLAMAEEVHGPNIDVETVSGTVYLTGVVESEAEKRRAAEVAGDVTGALEVRNLLFVEGGGA